jgi:hypothetical protein
MKCIKVICWTKVLICSFFSFSLGLFCQPITAQSYSPPSIDLSNVLPPSPTAAALAKYADIPVSLSTGTPDIQLPLYNVKSGNLNLPLSLSYHASGIKVTEVAGNVGLAWSLNAGGVITRVIRGKEDNGTYQNNQWYNWNTNPLDENNIEDYHLMLSLSNNTQDAIPDLYMYNFNGRSGKFIYADQLRMMPQAGFKIEKPSVGNDQWKITTEDGVIYTFAATEKTQIRSTQSVEPLTTVAWYLTKIESPDHTDIITLEYTNTMLLQDAGRSYSRSYKYSTIGIWSETNFSFNVSETKLYGQQLTKINFENGYVQLDNSWIREDYKQGTGVPTQTPRVDAVKIFNSSDQLLKGFYLSYSYFTTGAGTSYYEKRLKLNSLTETTHQENVLDPSRSLTHTFFYNTTSLPSTLSNAQDHWGYFNGKNDNTELIPSYKETNNEYQGADRNAYAGSMQAGILEKITYPTGGYTQLEYEPHDRDYFPILFNTITESVSVQKTTQNLTEVTNFSNEFSIPNVTAIDPQNRVAVTFSGSLSGIGGAFLDPIQVSHGESKLQLYESDAGDLVTLVHTIFLNAVQNYSESFFIDGSKTYILKASTKLYNASITGNINCQVPFISTTPEIIGGLRIKRKTVCDGIDHAKDIIHTYSYRKSNDPSKSTGGILAYPIYTSDFYTYESQGANCTYLEKQWINLSSVSKQNLGSGSHIVYSEVTTFFGNTGQLGKTTSYFTGFETNDYSSISYEADLDWRRGLLLKEETFDNAGVIKKRVENQYFTDPGTYKLFVGRVVSLTGIHPCQNVSNTSLPKNGFPVHFSQKMNIMISEWPYRKKTIETVFTPNAPATGIMSATDYFYDNPQHYQLTRTSFSSSKEEQVVTQLKYPQDLVLSGTEEAARQDLIAKNMISTVLEQTTTRSGVQLSKTKTNYKLFTANLNLPESIELGIAANPIEKRLEFQQYDVSGNLTQQAKKNDVAHSFIWGYNNSYPIAEATNAAVKDIFYTSFEDAEGNSTDGDSKTGKKSRTGGYTRSLSNLSNGQYLLSYWQKSGSTWVLQINTISISNGAYTISLSGQIDELRFYPGSALMTTYTYEPLVGMTSQCDINNKIIYYQYDDFGRLTLVRDQDNNIIKKICYNYAGQTENCN